MKDVYEEYKRICEILHVDTLLVFFYCPECGKILSIKKTTIWSHDHSLKIGYTRVSKCVFCSFSEVYTDVE